MVGGLRHERASVGGVVLLDVVAAQQLRVARQRHAEMLTECFELDHYIIRAQTLWRKT